METRTRVGVFGVGSLGQWHARIYSEIDEAELVGVYDVDGARAREIAGKYHTRAFSDPDELAGAIEAASIVAPTNLHRELALRLMSHGLHLLVEKPIAATTEEAEDMIRAAESRGLLLQVGHVERFNPVMTFLERHLSAPRFIEAIRLAPFPPTRPNGMPRGTEVSVVLDLMIHDLEIILHLVKSAPIHVSAIGVPVLSATEDIANVRIAFENGTVATVAASRISLDKMRKIRVFQADTYVSLDYLNQQGILCEKKDNQIVSAPVPIEHGEPLLAELKSFVHCVQTRTDPVVGGRQAAEALKLAARICRIIRENPS